jgi:DNA repair protein RecO (recombination protein O)
MAATFRDKAIVLKVTPMRDADRRYVVFTRDHGKMSLLAKGVRKGRSKMSPHMGWFGTVDIMVAQGRVFDRLAGASRVRSYQGIRESLPAMALVQGFLLTVDSLTRREQPEERIFSLIEEFFMTVESGRLAAAINGRGPVFDAAVLKLLDITGFGPELDRCVRCRGELGSMSGNGPDASMNFSRGGLECHRCFSAESLPLLDETVTRLRRFRSGSLAEAAVEPPPHHAASRVIEALLAGQVEERFPAMSFMRRVAA